MHFPNIPNLSRGYIHIISSAGAGMFLSCCGADTKSTVPPSPQIASKSAVSTNKPAGVVIASSTSPVTKQDSDSAVPPASLKQEIPSVKSNSIAPKDEEIDEEMSTEILAILQNIQERLSNIESGMGSKVASGPSSQQDAAGELSRSVKAFDEYTKTYLTPFTTACNVLGEDAASGGEMLCEAWAELRCFLIMASACKEPASAVLPSLLGNLSAKIKTVATAIKRNDWEKHMKTISEGVQSLNWIMVKPSPCDFITSYAEGAEYWANNIRKEFRVTNPDHIDFCNTFKTLMLELVKYVKEFHTTGVTWNPKGGDVKTYNGQAHETTAAAATAVGASSPKKPQGVDLFAALNKGGNITSGLKTVTKDMQTWRAEYKGDTPVVTATAPVVSKAAALSAVKGPPKFEFQNAGSKWLVENQSEKDGVITVTITEMKETVYIFGCIGATIDIKGKCKSIVVDGCKKTQVCFFAFSDSNIIV